MRARGKSRERQGEWEIVREIGWELLTGGDFPAGCCCCRVQSLKNYPDNVKSCAWLSGWQLLTRPRGTSHSCDDDSDDDDDGFFSCSSEFFCCCCLCQRVAPRHWLATWTWACFSPVHRVEIMWKHVAASQPVSRTDRQSQTASQSGIHLAKFQLQQQQLQQLQQQWEQQIKVISYRNVSNLFLL